MEILNYRESPRGSYEHATFDVYIPQWDLTIRRLKLCQSKKGTWYAKFPSFKESEAPDGKMNFVEYWDFGKRKTEFYNALMEDLRPFLPPLPEKQLTAEFF